MTSQEANMGRGGKKPGHTSLTTKQASDEVWRILNLKEDYTQMELWKEVQKVFPAIGLGSVRKAKTEWLMKQMSEVTIPTQDFYLKTSLQEYDQVIENAKVIERKTMATQKFNTSIGAQKNIIEAIKSRNSMLGLDKTSPLVNLNFVANVTDAEFLNIKAQ